MLKNTVIALLLFGATVSLLQGNNNVSGKRTSTDNDTLSKEVYATYIKEK